MKNKFLLFMMLIGITAQAQITDAARISLRNQDADDPSTVLSIATLQRIKLQVNDNYQVQAVFIFDDKEDAVFDNVETIQFFTGNIAEIDCNDPTATAIETASDAVISVYPNPATELIHISGMNENSHGSVININGRHVCDLDGRHTTIDVSGWTDGTYLIRIDNRIFKLIKH